MHRANPKYLYRILLPLVAALAAVGCGEADDGAVRVRSVLADRALTEAEWALGQEPETIVSFTCDRSAGGLNDFYSESDYWWPDEEDPDGPYIHRDGYNNPGIYSQHRQAVTRLSRIIGSLASAYVLTGDDRYALHAMRHARAWFIMPETRMNPHMLFAQSIQGVSHGRRTGVVDAIQLVEAAQGLYRIKDSPVVCGHEYEQVVKWFSEYLRWVTTHPYGIEAMNAGNSHAFCWIMQVAAFARLTGDGEKLDFCRQRMKNVLLSQQMETDGTFPAELARNKAYGCTLFVTDVVATVCQILSTPEDNLWEYTTRDGKGVHSAIKFIVPYIRDKSKWPLPPDVTFFDEWPAAHPCLLFGAEAYGNREWMELWSRLPQEIPPGSELERNFPVRNPLIWMLNREKLCAGKPGAKRYNLKRTTP